MLKKLFGGVRGSGDIEAQEKPAPRRKAVDREKLKLLTEFFPIGKKLRYIPEFKKEIIFDTLLVAYVVNGDPIYSWESIDLDPRGYPTAFRVGERDESVPAADVTLFQLLVPDTSDLEMTLDYYRRAMIGRGRQFSKGNYISLISNAGARGVSTMDTEVAKQIVLKDGPYAQTNMVLLTPELNTLEVTDQRNRTRAKTCVPTTFSVDGAPLRGPCTVVDISDSAVRVRVRDGETMPPMRQGDQVMLEIELDEGERQYTISGLVIRRSSEACVVKLDSFRKEGRFVAFGPLDILELKAGLLNYGK